MYLRSLKLDHVRLFERAELKFTRDDGSPRMFTVVIAENGHAKTTLLQAIALAAAGVGGANKLVGNAASFSDKRWVPSDEQIEAMDVCHVAARFGFSDTLHPRREYPPVDRPTSAPGLYSLLYCPFEWKQFDGESEYDLEGLRVPMDSRDRPLDIARAKDLPRWFVVGYGTGRHLPLPTAPADSGNRSIERLASLFRPEPLTATGFLDVLARQYGDDVARAYARTLRDVLVGDKLAGILPRDGAVRVDDLELRGQSGVRRSSDLLEAERVVLRFGDNEVVKVPAVWLSAGYQSTIAWVADLIGQVALDAGKVIAPEWMEGLVLIDEIDLHLHPRWQSTLVPALKRIFPRVQFVVTTHSPMILPELAPGEVLRLRADERGSVTGERSDDDPRLLTAAQLYREFFGVQGPVSLVSERFRRYGMLAGVTERTADEEREVHDLFDQLRREEVAVEAPEEANIVEEKP